MGEQDLQRLEETAQQEITAAGSLSALDVVRVDYLGKKGQLSLALRELGRLPADERKHVGEGLNRLKSQLQQSIEAKRAELEQRAMDEQLARETIDVTLPGRGQQQAQHHPIQQTIQRLIAISHSMGFECADGPEIEDEFYNFEALNTPSHHPARAMHDTFYFGDGRLLRSHTSCVQIRALQQQKPPVRIIAPGRVYRCDSDLTHTPMFHQIEGLLIDKHASFAQLKALITDWLQAFFERRCDVRFRASYFPFTEPSAEVDIACVHCDGKGCRVCAHTGWLEVLGCGMVHPNVLKAVDIDSEAYQGFAFGVGIERLAMLRYRVNDLRLFYENDLRFLGQF